MTGKSGRERRRVRRLGNATPSARRVPLRHSVSLLALETRWARRWSDPPAGRKASVPGHVCNRGRPGQGNAAGGAERGAAARRGPGLRRPGYGSLAHKHKSAAALVSLVLTRHGLGLPAIKHGLGWPAFVGDAWAD